MSATNRGAVRREADFYATPLSAFTPLLPYLDVTRSHYEPAEGDGRLVRAMLEFGISATGHDIRHGQDFLKDDEPCQRHHTIITNPPYSLAYEFCVKACAVSSEVFMLLRLNFLASQKRRAWFQRHEPSALFILSKRPCFTDDGKTDATEYAWFYWGERHRGIIHL